MQRCARLLAAAHHTCFPASSNRAASQEFQSPHRPLIILLGQTPRRIASHQPFGGVRIPLPIQNLPSHLDPQRRPCPRCLHITDIPTRRRRRSSPSSYQDQADYLQGPRSNTGGHFDDQSSEREENSRSIRGRRMVFLRAHC